MQTLRQTLRNLHKLITHHASRITLAVAVGASALCTPHSAFGQWIYGANTVANVYSAPIMKGFQAQTFSTCPLAGSTTVMITNVNTNDTWTFSYWVQQYGQAGTNIFPLATLQTNFSAATLAALAQTNSSGTPTNGGTVYLPIPQTTFTVTNVLWGTASNSAWGFLTGGTGRTNGLTSNP
jgi:hypothetical protein